MTGRFSNSDALLSHFLAFSSTPSLHVLPQSVQDGVPLFHILPNSSKPVPSATSGGKYVTPLAPPLDKHGFSPRSSPLHQYWRPLCTIDTSQWYRWFHSDKLVLILHPEYPLPRNLLVVSSTGRYGSPLCRPAASHLFELLKGWSSLVLLESHSYVRLLPSREEPRYFCLVRVAQKHPCVVLHIGHIEGTPHLLQVETVASLVSSLEALSRVLTKETSSSSSKTKRKMKASLKPLKNKPGVPVVTIVRKQLQKVMIR